jgi:hypothetical protein
MPQNQRRASGLTALISFTQSMNSSFFRAFMLPKKMCPLKSRFMTVSSFV